MTLGAKLAIVLVAFLALLVAVIRMAFRERRLSRQAAGDLEAQNASDARVMAMIFSSILGGMLLTALVAWLVFL